MRIPIMARSRWPTILDVSMLRINSHTYSMVISGVLPLTIGSRSARMDVVDLMIQLVINCIL